MSQNKDPKATPDELHQQLTYLNLPFIRDHVEELARQAADKQWSHLGFLGRLLEGEAAQRQDRARVRRIHQARFSDVPAGVSNEPGLPAAGERTANLRGGYSSRVGDGQSIRGSLVDS